MLFVCADASHKATLGELDRVREELIEERAKRHLEAGGSGQKSNEESSPSSDPVIEALNCCEDSVSTYLLAIQLQQQKNISCILKYLHITES